MKKKRRKNIIAKKILMLNLNVKIDTIWLKIKSRTILKCQKQELQSNKSNDNFDNR